jgi:hypothetical protein
MVYSDAKEAFIWQRQQENESWNTSDSKKRGEMLSKDIISFLRCQKKTCLIFYEDYEA